MTGTTPGRHRRPTTSWWGSRPGWQKALIGLAALSVLLCTALGAAGLALERRYEGRVQRDDLLGPGTGPRDDRRWADGPLNLLLLGSDSREGEPDEATYPGARADTVMLLHVTADRSAATVVSLPRDSYVPVPASAPDWPGGMNKLNAAFAFGGAALTAQTVAALTSVPLDGVVVANFAAVRRMVDAVGGIQVCLPYAVVSATSDRSWPAGCQDLDGAAADDLVRQRHQVPGGDLGRIRHQHLVVAALVEKLTTGDLLTDPVGLDRLLTTVAEALVVDRELDLRRLVLALRDLHPASVRFVTTPVASANLTTPVGSAVQLDEARSGELFEAIRTDSVEQWLERNPAAGT